MTVHAMDVGGHWPAKPPCASSDKNVQHRAARHRFLQKSERIFVIPNLTL